MQQRHRRHCRRLCGRDGNFPRQYELSSTPMVERSFGLMNVMPLDQVIGEGGGSQGERFQQYSH